MSAVHSDSRLSPSTRGENSSHWLAHLTEPKWLRSWTVSKSNAAASFCETAARVVSASVIRVLQRRSRFGDVAAPPSHDRCRIDRSPVARGGEEIALDHLEVIR